MFTSLNSATWVWENMEKTLDPERLAARLEDPLEALVEAFFTDSGAGAGAGSGSGAGAGAGSSSFFLVFFTFFSLSACNPHHIRGKFNFKSVLIVFGFKGGSRSGEGENPPKA